jgi:hypothetical protein
MAAAIALGAGGLSLKNWSHKDASGGTLASRRPQVGRCGVRRTGVPVAVGRRQQGFGKMASWPNPPPLVCTTLPVITATDLIVGEAVTCDNGTWEGPDILFSRQWRSGGFPVDFETNGAYVLSVNDIGETVDCVVYARNADGMTFVYTAPVGPIDARARTAAP